MEAKLNAVPVKVRPGFTPGIGIVSYAMQADLARQMSAQESTYLFYALRVMNDEVWNFIDGQRNIGEIAESVCQEFGFELDPGMFVPLVEQLVTRGFVTLEEIEE